MICTEREQYIVENVAMGRVRLINSEKNKELYCIDTVITECIKNKGRERLIKLLPNNSIERVGTKGLFSKIIH